MKNLTFFPNLRKVGLLFLLGIMFIGNIQTVEACVDPDTIPTVNCHYDSSFTQVAIRVSNLRLMTEQPNKFCSCALSTYSDLFTTLLYVAFVDSGTNTPYENFDQWSAEAGASTAWDNTTTGYPSWNGFVSEVINGGLSPSNPVELIIRAALPPGYTLVILDSSLSSTFLGTDEWSDTGDTLTQSHRGLNNLYQPGTEFIGESLSYFMAMDSTIDSFYTATSTNINPRFNDVSLSLFPNPVQDQLTVSVVLKKAEPISVRIIDMKGRAFIPVYEEVSSAGTLEKKVKIQDLDLSPGVYMLQIQGATSFGTKKFLIDR